MKRRLIYGVVVGVLCVNLLAGLRLYLSTAQGAEKDSAYPNLELFSIVLQNVRKNYVDGDKVSYKDLVYGALKGMVNSLDPHSEFMEADKYKDLQDDTQGNFGGLGIVVSMKDSFVTVVSPMEDTPGFKAGILAGDRIIKIDGKSTQKMSLPEAVKNLRGEPGSEVTITIERPSTGMIKDLTLKRAIINVAQVKDINGKKEFPLGENRIGYISIVQFGEKTGAELETAINKLKAQGMQALVLDLRWNPGGLLDQAAEVSEKFLPRGKLIVTTEGRSPEQSSIRRARGRGDQLVTKDGQRIPMVVLVNVGTASAAEIVAGCLQDSKRAIVLGERTFGKGSVQNILPMPDGSALRLTIAKYYTPSHKVIHEHGIEPDIIVPMSEEQGADVLMQRMPGGLDGIPEADLERISNARDLQLDRALDLLKGINLLTEREPAENAPGPRNGKVATAK